MGSSLIYKNVVISAAIIVAYIVMLYLSIPDRLNIYDSAVEISNSSAVNTSTTSSESNINNNTKESKPSNYAVYDNAKEETKTSSSNSSKTSQVKDTVKNKQSTIIYNHDGIVITISDIINNKSFTYTIENNTKHDILFIPYFAAINNCSIVNDHQSSQTITPGNKHRDSYKITACSVYGIDKVKTIDFFAKIYDEEDGIMDFGSKQYASGSLTTTQNTNSNTEITISKPFYCDENVEIGLIKTGNSIKDCSLIIHNLTDSVIEVYLKGVSINNFMAESFHQLGGAITPHGYYNTSAVSDKDDYIILWDSFDDEIAEKGFDNVERIEGTLSIELDVLGSKSETYEKNSVIVYE